MEHQAALGGATIRVQVAPFCDPAPPLGTIDLWIGEARARVGPVEAADFFIRLPVFHIGMANASIREGAKTFAAWGYVAPAIASARCERSDCGFFN